MSSIDAAGTSPGDTATRPPAPGAPPAMPGAPVRARGVELLGEVAGSGYRQPPALVRRSDGQVVQLTKLLYLVLAAVDGVRTPEGIAELVGRQVRRAVTAENVQALCDRLRTLGLLRRADGSEPELRRANPLLALRFKYVVSDPEATNRLTAPFAALFAPVVVALVCLAFAAVCAWLLLEKGLGSATHHAFDRPGLLLLVFVLTVISAGFHEIGHAAAARYGGARPGAMGAGLYLIWPAFYTDVTDSYRLGRAGRVRTDLGGLYFNAVIAVLMFGAWRVSGWDAILLIIATQVLQMLRQLAPLVRFDGYHVLADLTGVPDLYRRIRPTLLALLPGRRADPEARALRPWARAVVTAWVVVVVPVLLGTLVLMVLALPRLLGTAAHSLREQAGLLGQHLGDGDVAGALVRLLAVVAIAVPVLGVVYLLARTVRQVLQRVWRGTAGRPGRRALAAAAALLAAGGLAWAWWPTPGAYRPVQAYERGALQDALPAALLERLPVALDRGTPTGLVEGRPGRAQVVWPSDTSLPAADAPELAVVLVPRADGDPAAQPPDAGTSAEPAWVFPFDRPLPPEEGDNQALAVNTEDGGTLYDVAFALVWADDDTVLNTNEAYALASCTDCTTVAVAFQVVLVVGQADVVVPQNLSAAVNYSCVECVTYALATQLVITLDGPVQDSTGARLAALWSEMQEFGRSIQDVPLAELQARLTAYEAQILEILREDPTARPAAEAPTPGGTASPGGAQSPEATPTATPGEPASTPSSTPTGGTTEKASPSAPATSATPTADPTGSATPSPTPTPSGDSTPTPTPSGTGTPEPTPTGKTDPTSTSAG
ncbi:hypothetical protein [Georgenia thermotolerans]|uniref:Peptide zinc metalloprotease protein n=1 Tax=Georgenia thermotolerans TaxID=527326 RepID=A0A7J5URD6_9MICO|nr:hypothetical protein [Georgenia thermotolerans]KAE8765012.1 hypothetical protein GB883_05845 [Georgenia thermotolerans]